MSSLGDGKLVDEFYLEVSPATERLIGKSKKDILGKTRTELFGKVTDEFPLPPLGMSTKKHTMLL
jgi:hypothetical protein